MQELRAIIHGKVQRVWFRKWTCELAKELGVTGWVRNRPDGHVEALAQGEPMVLKLFAARLHEGPLLARVSRVESTIGELREHFDSFTTWRQKL
ncbi:acylphosphatase [Pseudodesulfovibrio piezophilus]|uniref:acylphosphatase n=1 Tax=Pseudodesulfovibrio piezophilus (strain DSM 21447 / JCM 15486 / C1TLV30) TaxID=1322246 RepID=M1WMX5_PSEP2|nr:acylphosphatase [Pseudodesulfovibrio piezophilus]CCH50040.1 Acylphosphatase [Pseudodesulfovibrio piezophilus C1TLV30]